MTKHFTHCGSRLLASLAGACCLLAAGCGNGELSGKVRYEGTPLRGGTVTFVTQDGKARASAAIRPDGTYAANHVPLGTLNVGVETESAKHEAAGRTPAGRYVPIPEQFGNPHASGLRVTVRGGPQTEDIELK